MSELRNLFFSTIGYILCYKYNNIVKFILFGSPTSAQSDRRESVDIGSLPHCLACLARVLVPHILDREGSRISTLEISAAGSRDSNKQSIADETLVPNKRLQPSTKSWIIITTALQTSSSLISSWAFHQRRRTRMLSAGMSLTTNHHQ